MSAVSKNRTARVAAAGAVAGLTLLAATACGPDDTPSPPPSSAPAPASAAPSATTAGLPAGLPSLDVLKKWKLTDWDKWAKQHVMTPATKGFWDLQKMLQAQPTAPVGPAQPPSAPSAGANDPLPSAIPATAVAHPYNQDRVDGKIFFDKADGKHYVCSGTVVSDPAHPGKSNLVWTAGHCVTGGQDGQTARNVTFVPAFNSSGAVSKGKKSTPDQYAPFGAWPAQKAITSPQWQAEGTETGSAANQYDFAIIKVSNPDGGAKSLEETVGGSVPVLFNAPRAQLSLTAIGYPAAAPFDGTELEKCDSGKPSQLSFDAGRPAMYTIGCTMTGGSSGGGWFATEGGKTYLVSNTSIGPADTASWLAGPYLDEVAAGAFDYISKQS
ncbi:V8-like Glu-specific endopeptidase [Kitasatospora sp. MAP12-15]|uniref:trypsin-like serine peptidase n=1 Tax=unclassified Kitasatospora TaxID=2633591 RepID=UPI002473011E|nr:trypsin-like peptidase domain-containing protein [Kitasatospora sp. MAP12-44]MDH6113080.1 V8-like Glu-specific endopeptidase [Kitasatospora sp. MAP12-44]